MKRKEVSEIMLALLFASMLLLAFNVKPVKAEPTTIVVPDDYPTIQGAINAASEGDTIFVRNGIYYENVVVNKSLSLVGEDGSKTIIDGNGTGDVIYMESVENVNISKLRVQNGRFGIWANSTLDSIISMVNVSNCRVGIVMSDSKYGWGFPMRGNTIKNSIISYSADVGIAVTHHIEDHVVYNNTIIHAANGGVYLFQSRWSSVQDNVLFDTGAIGILLTDCEYNVVAGNFISGCRSKWPYTGAGIGVSLFAGQNTIVENIIVNNTRGVWHYYAGANHIFHNNFVNNTYPAYTNGHDIWDDGYPSGGNYWSTYTGIDTYSGPYQNITGSDGIGDTPYVIGGNDQDNYPLMKPWKFSPEEMIEGLIEEVESMNLQQGIDNSLDAKLEAVLESLEALNAGQRNDAVNKLEAFINEVEGQRGKKLTNEQADTLVSEAQRIIDLIQQ